jgi:hypothetical protein
MAFRQRGEGNGQSRTTRHAEKTEEIPFSLYNQRCLLSIDEKDGGVFSLLFVFWSKSSNPIFFFLLVLFFFMGDRRPCWQISAQHRPQPTKEPGKESGKQKTKKKNVLTGTKNKKKKKKKKQKNASNNNTRMLFLFDFSARRFTEINKETNLSS